MTVPLKVVQIVTLVSSDGAYGGPVRVAENQIAELAKRGHHVSLLASSFERKKHVDKGNPLVRTFPAFRLFPKLGFAGVTAPLLLLHLPKLVRSADVVHIHLARDLVTLPAALICLVLKKPYVLQTHGMVDESDKRLAILLDFLATRRVLRGARKIFWLTELEKTSLQKLTGAETVALSKLENGVPNYSPSPAPVTAGKVVDILFLARLHARKRPVILAEAANRLSGLIDRELFKVSFVGPDEGEEEKLRRSVENSATHVSIDGPMEPDETYSRIRQCDIFVLPSVDEPFPMGVLEAMSAGKPVVVTDSCGLAPYISDAGAGIVVDTSEANLTAALRLLVENVELRESMGLAARGLAKAKFSMEAVVNSLEDAYRMSLKIEGGDWG